MAIKYLSDISLEHNEIKNVIVDNKTTTQRDALTTIKGRAIFNETTNKFQFHDGTEWLSLAEIDTEQIQDIVGNMLGGDETGGITVTYDDENNHIDFSLGSLTINGYEKNLGQTLTLVTDDIAEDASPTNLWYTDARARASVSVTDSGGDGSLSYDSATGVITYTGPSATDVRAHISGGTGVTITNGEISIGQAVATNSNVTFANTTVNDLTVNGTLNSDDITATTVTIEGNLTVTGTTSTVNTETINLADNIILLNSNHDAAGTPTQDSGIEVNRGSSDNAKLYWDESSDRWSQQKGTGTEYYVHTEEHDVALGTHTSGNYIKNLTAGTGIDISNTNGEGAEREISIEQATSSNVGGAAFDATDFAIDEASGVVTLAKDPEITLSGDVTGSGTMTNLGNVSITTTVANNQSFAASIGDGSATTYEVEHSLGTKDVIVQLYDRSSNDTVYADVVRSITSKSTPDNWVQIQFATAPSNNDIRVLVIKCV
ncbi:MAG: hypothetical protein CMI60_16120 [Parvibaculum sp.]|nr:hypothetical protein [Parvibaculum sp.]